jgi:hypothetical protein
MAMMRVRPVSAMQVMNLETGYTHVRVNIPHIRVPQVHVHIPQIHIPEVNVPAVSVDAGTGPV